MELKTYIIVALLTAGVFIGCQKEYVQPSPPLKDVKFQRDIIPIFTKNCAIAGCHNGAGGGAPINLSAAAAYEDLFANEQIDTSSLPSSAVNSNLYVRITATSGFMPPTGQLPSSDKAKILLWIKSGAKND